MATTDPRPGAASAAATCRCPISIPRIPTSFISTSTVTWKSTDGGKTWTGFRGAPGGDDYQNIWINPDNPEHHPASPAIRARSSPSTAAIAGVPGTTSRPRRCITWSPTMPSLSPVQWAAGERLGLHCQPRQRWRDHFSRLASCGAGRIRLCRARSAGSRHRVWRQTDALRSPHGAGAVLRRCLCVRRTFASLRTAPVLFSPIDPHLLYFAANTLWQTRDGGRNWKQISPDLTRKTWDVPASVGNYRF